MTVAAAVQARDASSVERDILEMLERARGQLVFYERNPSELRKTWLKVDVLLDLLNELRAYKAQVAAGRSDVKVFMQLSGRVVALADECVV